MSELRELKGTELDAVSGGGWWKFNNINKDQGTVFSQIGANFSLVSFNGQNNFSFSF
jgi:hypothetical protein